MQRGIMWSLGKAADYALLNAVDFIMLFVQQHTH